MRLEVVKGFFSSDLCAKLNAWATEGAGCGWLDFGIDSGVRTQTRLTTRVTPEAFTYPEFVLRASERIREFCGVSHLPLVAGGRDGVIVSYTKRGGDVYEHRDPAPLGAAVLRCNVMTSKSERGGQLYVDGRPVEIEEGDLHCYLASEHKHRVGIVLDDKPRIMWMFGALVQIEDWNTGKIGANLGIS